MTQWRHLFSLEIFLEKGNILLHGLKTSSGTYGDEILTLAHNEDLPPVVRWGPDEQITYHTDTSWKSELAYLFDCILRNHPVHICNSADALRVMRIIDRIYQQR
jgi:predicted dehydrogenase